MQGVFEFYRELPARPERPERLFFGLLPDPATSIRVGQFSARFIDDNRLDGVRPKTDRLHVSLHHVGDYRRLRTKFIYAATQAGRAVALQPFVITFRFIKSFEVISSQDGPSRNRPLVLLAEGDALHELHRTLGAAMKRIGLSAAAHFMPHMTLLYGSKPVPVQAIEPIRFAVNDFALIHSALGLGQHKIVDRWPLEGRASVHPSRWPAERAMASTGGAVSSGQRHSPGEERLR